MDPDRLMRNMMQGMGMGMPFGMGMGGLFADFDGSASRPHHSHQMQDPFMSMMPQGFMRPMSMMMMDPFQSMQQAMSMANNGNGNNFSYCSSSVTSYTTDEHGRPQVFQQSNEVKQGPNGVKETKSALKDSRTGRQEMAIGHHLYDKAHIKKKSKNVYTGEEEQAEDLVNLEEDEAERFEQNWRQQAQNITANSRNQIGYDPYSRPSRNHRLALTNGVVDENPRSSSSASGANHLGKNAMKIKKKKKSREELNK